MDFGSISMERLEVPFHEHPLIPFTRFVSGMCELCYHDISKGDFDIYGGYRCNELGCGTVVFHKDCAKPLQEINHSSHSDHSLKLIILDSKLSACRICEQEFKVGYSCSTCDFNLDLKCAMIRYPLPQKSYGHEHPLELFRGPRPLYEEWKSCEACHKRIDDYALCYRCDTCEFVIHVDCVVFCPESYHTSHPQHPLKSLKWQVPDYAYKNCLLCEKSFDIQSLHHCDVCNFSICRACMENPPPICVESLTTHEHQLHLVPRLINFTCNACGTLGDISPYFCLQCNFMIHRQCIDLPRVININRHDHRISYTTRLGHGEWKCRVCRKKVDGFYGAYTCVECPNFAAHARCATRGDIWDMVELEGTLAEEVIAPFEVIDDNTIKHCSHDHNLGIHKDGHCQILPENVFCEACVLQICSEPFYSCEHCDFILHEKCANLPRKKRHPWHNQPFILDTDTIYKVSQCGLCLQDFTGFKYKASPYATIDVRCGSFSDSLEHESHPHPLYYYSFYPHAQKHCSRCGEEGTYFFSCDECDYILDVKCAVLPKKVMKNRYDDHPLFLSYDDMNVDGVYWCEACETKVDPKKGYYACIDCGITLHVSCVVGDFSYIVPGPVTSLIMEDTEVVSNTSICRQLCSWCNSRCKLPSILKHYSKDGVDVYFCSFECFYNFRKGQYLF